mmetsp:Transcript_52072/g.82794  ORF Transcript_52072/g.82794 Transcript_52072/m.82794 type:complete len:84 (+) Transcript_52072:428-679(+)
MAVLPVRKNRRRMATRGRMQAIYVDSSGKFWERKSVLSAIFSRMIPECLLLCLQRRPKSSLLPPPVHVRENTLDAQTNAARNT